MNAIDLLNEMQTNLGVPWQSQNAGAFSDTVLAGEPDTEVTGIVTTFAASVDVLRRAIAAGHNTIICREPPFFSHGEVAPIAYRSGPEPPKELMVKDAVCQAKSEIIRSNKLVVMRFRDNWGARTVDGQLAGLAKALKWEPYHLTVNAPKTLYRPGNNFFQLPPISLETLLGKMKESLNVKTTRVMGDKKATVSRSALLPGYVLVPDLQAAYSQRSIDLVVIGEPVEWEGAEYIQDMIAAKRTKAAILLGNEVSEEPGSGEMAAWLKTFVRVPVNWVPTGEPFNAGV